MIFRLNLFFKEAILFSATALLGIMLAYNYSPSLEGGLVPVNISWDYSIIFLAFFLVLSLFFMRFKSFNRFFLKTFLAIVVYSGAQSVFGIVFDFPWSFLAAIVSVLSFVLVKNVLTHNIGMVLGLAGVSGVLGISISPHIVIVLLVLLSFYDIIAVYWTKHMVYMARGMMESGAIFGFVIPFQFSGFLTKNEEAHPKIGENFMVLGSGDITLPAIMASSVAVVSFGQSLVVFLFSLAGLLLTHVIFINQKERKPMAALPPIATMTIIGYLVATMI